MAGSRCFIGVEALTACERQAQPEVGGLDVAVHEARAVQRREPAQPLQHHLAQLEEAHAPRARVLLEVRADEVLEHEEGHALRDAAVDDVRDVRVVEAGERRGLLDERREDALRAPSRTRSAGPRPSGS
jgi:hypothetical protein